MCDYTGIITFRKKLRHNCRIEALRGIIGNNPALFPNVASLKFQHECTESEQEEIPADLERLVRDVLNALEPKGAECLLLTPTTKLCQLAEEDFWINLYDELWKCVLLGPAPKPGKQSILGVCLHTDCNVKNTSGFIKSSSCGCK
jgi:hypothetical protein